MEGLGIFAQGLVIGLSIAAPVGPIGLLCIRRTLADGMALGFATGLGAAVADGVYGLVAGLGITSVSDALVAWRDVLAVAGGIVLLWLGLRTMRTRPADKAAPARGRGLAGAFATTFALTLTNPATILSFVAVFAGLGLAGGGSAAGAMALVLGVFLGSALWWLGLTGTLSLAHGRVAPATLVWINRVSGAVLALFGIAAIVSGLRGF